MQRLNERPCEQAVTTDAGLRRKCSETAATIQHCLPHGIRRRRARRVVQFAQARNRFGRDSGLPFMKKRVQRMQRHCHPVWVAAIFGLFLSACGKEKPARATVSNTSPAAASEVREATASEDCPGQDDGSELVGRSVPDWQLSQWVNGEPRTLKGLRGQVILVRFWTSPGCPFCEKSMPAVQALSEEFGKEPVTFIGAFHSKPKDSIADMSEPSAIAKGWGVTFPLAYDGDWNTLDSWWMDTGHRHATSATFVIGKDGKIVHVHPGPVFHPSKNPNESKQNTDFEAIREAIRGALTES